MKAKKICIIIGVFFLFLILLSSIFTLLNSKGSFGGKVALIRLEGPIVESKSLVDEIDDYTKNTAVKAIVLRVNSPGGGVVPSQEIYDAVKKAAARKKVIVSMGSLAASGGYYISAPATRIIANPGTITGSIGVIMEIPNVKGLLDKVGVKTEVIKSGIHKDLASPFRDMGKEERKILQGVMDDVHEQFISAVAEGRKLPVESVRKIADGRIFSGRQAIKAGLVDELGDLDFAVKTAARLAGLKGEPEILVKKERHNLLDLFTSRIHESVSGMIPTSELKYMYAP